MNSDGSPGYRATGVDNICQSQFLFKVFAGCLVAFWGLLEPTFLWMRANFSFHILSQACARCQGHEGHDSVVPLGAGSFFLGGRGEGALVFEPNGPQ